MKKILVVLAFVVMSINAMALDVWVKGGIIDGVGSKKIKDPGYTASLEVSQGILGFADLGVGAAYNGNLKFNDGNDNVDNVGFDILPVYGFAKFNLFPIAIKPYLIAKAGTNFIIRDKTDYLKGRSKPNKAGLYGAVGVGMELLSSLEAEMLYSVSHVKNNGSGKDDIQMISLTLGYNFL